MNHSKHTSKDTMQPIKLGVVGVLRGRSFANMAAEHNMEVVALCDIWEEKLHQVGKEMNVATYTNYDTFLDHEMDAVVLANYFHEHAPFAIKALEAGKHVLSETAACKTVGEGVALVEAVEKHSDQVYMFAENYPFFLCNQGMREAYQNGEVGEMQFGEGEYIHAHDQEDLIKMAPGMNHWRNTIPASYYCTHALAPLMYITDTKPISVNSLYIPRSAADEHSRHVRINDAASVIMVRMSNESVITLNGVSLRGNTRWWRIHGTRGLIENLRTGDTQMIRVYHEPFEIKEGEYQEKIYAPQFPFNHEQAMQAGHSGGDYFTSYYFQRAIREHTPPIFDVYSAMDMTLVGIQAFRSALENGAPYEVPNLRKKEIRDQYRKDDWSPYPEDKKPGQPYPSYKGEIKIPEETIKHAHELWDNMGYKIKKS